MASGQERRDRVVEVGSGEMVERDLEGGAHETAFSYPRGGGETRVCPWMESEASTWTGNPGEEPTRVDTQHLQAPGGENEEAVDVEI